jgi:allophanate hydrolase
MSVAAFGAFAAEVPPPLGIGSLQLVDGSWVKGFICEPCGFDGAQDISAYGGFGAYVEATRRARD